MMEAWRLEIRLDHLRSPVTDEEVAWARRSASREDWKFKRGRARLKYRAVNQVLK